MGLYSDGVDDPSQIASGARALPGPAADRRAAASVACAAPPVTTRGGLGSNANGHVGVGMVGKQAAHRSPHDDGAEGKRME